MTPEDLSSFLPAIVERLRHYRECGIDETISAHDNMFEIDRREHYFATGRHAITIIAQAMINAGIDNFTNVLDLPCGSGRVLRHLVRFLPEASVIASDIDLDHVEFCHRQLGAEPLLSREDLRQVAPDRPIDLLWCGSLLSHLPPDGFKTALRHMIGWLGPGGIGIFTLHGRWTLLRQARTPYKYMEDGTFAPIAEGLNRDGFGYVNYKDAGSRLGQESYGLSVSLPSWVMRMVEEMEEVQLLEYKERGWDNHQDVLVLRKFHIAARPWIFEDRNSGITGKSKKEV
jgi:SAM-dependent methyltransferase